MVFKFLSFNFIQPFLAHEDLNNKTYWRSPEAPIRLEACWQGVKLNWRHVYKFGRFFTNLADFFKFCRVSPMVLNATPVVLQKIMDQSQNSEMF